jgi:hypothetical protein
LQEPLSSLPFTGEGRISWSSMYTYAVCFQQPIPIQAINAHPCKTHPQMAATTY